MVSEPWGRLEPKRGVEVPRTGGGLADGAKQRVDHKARGHKVVSRPKRPLTGQRWGVSAPAISAPPDLINDDGSRGRLSEKLKGRQGADGTTHVGIGVGG